MPEWSYRFFAGDSAMPPSLGDDRVSYIFSIFGQFGVTMLALGWLWLLVTDLFEDPHRIKDPITVSRVIWILVLGGIVMRMAPDTALTMLWPEIQAPARASLAYWGRILDGLSYPIFFAAWLLERFSKNIINAQLIRQPIPVDLWPTWRRVRRPVLIIALITAVSVVLGLR